MVFSDYIIIWVVWLVIDMNVIKCTDVNGSLGQCLKKWRGEHGYEHIYYQSYHMYIISQ